MNSNVLHVLICEAETIHLQALFTFLENHASFAVESAVDCEQAWACIAQIDKPYDVALIDIALPSETPYSSHVPAMALMKRLKDYHPQTGIILFRHPEIDVSLDKALQEGAFRYLDKSYPYDELIVLMRHAARDYQFYEAVRAQSLFEHLLRVHETSFEHANEKEAINSLLHGIQQLHFDRVRIYLLSDDERYMIGAAHVGMGDHFVGIKRAVVDDRYMQEMLRDPRPRIHTRQHGQIVPLQEALDKEGVNEWVSIPLIARGGELIGALSADNKKSQRPIHELELGPVTLVAGQVASTIAQARLSAEIKRRLGQLEVLRETTLAITSEQNHEQLLRMIIEHAVKLLNAKGGGIYQYDPAQNILICVADYNRPDFVGVTLRVGEELVGRIVEEKVSYKVIPNYPEWDGAIWPDRPLIFHSLLGVPLRWHGDITGVLFIGDESGRHFQETDIQLLQMFADQAAISLVNAQRATQDAAKLIRLEKVARATKEITDNLDDTPLDQRLTLIAQHAIDILDAEVSGVLLVQPSGRLRLEAGAGHLETDNGVGKEYPIFDDIGTGLTSHIATTQQVFNFHGEALWEHPASDRVVPDHLPSGRRYSMLAVPLKKYQDGSEELVGLLNVENKKGSDGKPHPNLGFTEEDASILTIFAEAAVTAISNAHLVIQLQTQQQQWQRTVKAAEEVARTIASGKPHETLRAIARSTKRAVGCDWVLLYVHDELRSHEDHANHAAMINCVSYNAEDNWQEHIMEANEIDSLLAIERSYSTNMLDDPRLCSLQGLQEPRMHSCVVLPLRAADQKVGVMLVGYQALHNITTAEFEEMKLFADQAAVGVHNALLLQQAAKRTGTLRALDEAGRVLTSSLEITDVLTRLAEQAWRLTHTGPQTGGYVDIWLKENDCVRIVAAFPPEQLDTVSGLWPHGIDLNHPEAGRIGVVGRAVMTRKPQWVTDVDSDPDYLRSHDEIRSELVEPIRIGQNIIGVINAELPESEKFDEEKRLALRALAAQASIAIQNARHFEEIKRSRGIIGARTAVAWMGMTSMTWRHAIGNDATTIRDRVELLRTDITSNLPPQHIESHLNVIDQMAQHIQERPITAPLSDEEGVSSVDVNDVIRARLPRLQERNRDIYFVARLSTDHTLSTRVSAAWLKRALDYPIDNAIEAMHGVNHKVLTIVTRRAGKDVEIVVHDTGPGMPQEVQASILREPIPKQRGERGSGVGLLIAQTIVQTYGGDIRLEKTSSKGTTIIISLPLEEPMIQEELKTGRRNFLLICNKENAHSWRSINTALSSIGEVSLVSEDEACGYSLQEIYDLIIVDPVFVNNLSDFITNFLERQKDAKIVILTASPAWRAAREALQAGAYDYIDKSLPVSDFLIEIEHMLDIM